MMNFIIENIISNFHIYFVFLVIGTAIIIYAIDKYMIETVSIIIIMTLSTFFYFFPSTDVNGYIISPLSFFEGFTNPGLISVISLLIIGQSVIRSGLLSIVPQLILKLTKDNVKIAIITCLIMVLFLSSILNNTPIVIIFIPILTTLANNNNISTSKVMIPLSYMAICGGMLTLLGSSTNILISSSMETLGLEKLRMFEFVLPALLICVISSLYILFILPKILPNKLTEQNSLYDNRIFIIEIIVPKNSYLDNAKISEGLLPNSKSIKIRLIERNGQKLLPPYQDNMELISGDIIVISGLRSKLSELISQKPILFSRNNQTYINQNENLSITSINNINQSQNIVQSITKNNFQNNNIAQQKNNSIIQQNSIISQQANPTVQSNNTISAQNKNLNNSSVGKKDKTNLDQTHLAEIIIHSSSHLLNQSFKKIQETFKSEVQVIGIKRQGNTISNRLDTETIIQGDTLLILGRIEDIMDLRNNKDIVVTEWKYQDILSKSKSIKSILILLFTLITASLNILPIYLATFLGAGFVLLLKLITFRQLTKSIDKKILFLIASSIAMGTALQDTGGANIIAKSLTIILSQLPEILIINIIFTVVVIFTNILSNNTTALLFTPIAVNLATQLNMDVRTMIYAIIFASNCSFLTPIGYQTNLLVLSPGRYSFSDFIKGGLPLFIITSITYSLYYYFFS